ncbi:MAG: hypothetical protein QOJ40_694 [Verrucomicrobiota bacterium]
MKKCTYCGKLYSDDTVVCPLDQNAVVLSRVAPGPERRTIIIRRFAALSMLKIVAVGCIISLCGFSLMMGFLALFGAHTVQWNHQSLTGMAGLMNSVFIAAFLSFGFTLFGWIGFVISFWLFSKFSSLSLEYIADEKPGQTDEKRPDT